MRQSNQHQAWTVHVSSRPLTSSTSPLRLTSVCIRQPNAQDEHNKGRTYRVKLGRVCWKKFVCVPRGEQQRKKAIIVVLSSVVQDHHAVFRQRWDLQKRNHNQSQMDKCVRVDSRPTKPCLRPCRTLGARNSSTGLPTR